MNSTLFSSLCNEHTLHKFAVSKYLHIENTDDDHYMHMVY